MKEFFLAAVVALAQTGCERPTPPPREEPKPEIFSGFTSATPLPLEGGPKSIALEPTPTPAPAIAPEARAAKADLAKTYSDYRSDPAARPPADVNLHALQSLNNAIIGHMRQIEEAEDRVRATRKKEIDDREGGE